MDVRHALHQQVVELDRAQLFGERDVIGEAALARGFLRRFLFLDQDGIEPGDAHRGERGVGLLAALRIRLLPDQDRHVAEGYRSGMAG